MKIKILPLCFSVLIIFIDQVEAGKIGLYILASLMLTNQPEEQQEQQEQQEESQAQQQVSIDQPKSIRKLATVRVISDIQPIPGADNIEVASIDGWKSVVQKASKFKVGQKVIYFEIDSFLPVEQKFESLRKYCYKKMEDGREGFRLKTIMLKDQVSQGLVMHLSDAIKGPLNLEDYSVGDDLTEKLGVTKYQPPVKLNTEGIIGFIPGFIRKTDEERIQNLSSDYESYKGKDFFVSEKLDGASSTFYKKGEHFGVCSKNYELEKSTENTFWKLAVENDLENKLRQMERDLAIQAEIVGDKIQKNSYAIHGHKMYVFNIYDIEKHAYLPKTEMLKICKDLALPICPVIAENRNVPDTIDQILQEANGLSRINDKQEREGLVWVFDGGKPSERVSFKTISNEYLLDKKIGKKTRKKHQKKTLEKRK